MDFVSIIHIATELLLLPTKGGVQLMSLSYWYAYSYVTVAGTCSHGH